MVGRCDRPPPQLIWFPAMESAPVHPALRPGPWPPRPMLDTPEAREALSCPLCGYSLCGLSAAQDPVCPECGYRIDWQELLRAGQYKHRYLFEHHPRDNFWSFLGTFFAGLRPARFWSSLNAGHQIRPRRLLIYWAAVSVIAVMSGFGGRLLVAAGWLAWERRAVPAPRGSPPPMPFLEEVWQRVGWTDLEVALNLIGFAWPWLTVGALLIFQSSMRRLRVRPGHLVRCVVYSGDIFVWAGILTLALASTASVGTDPWARAHRAALAAFAFIAAATWKLGTAYRRYLHSERPWATILSIQVVVILALAAALSLATPQFGELFLTRDNKMIWD